MKEENPLVYLTKALERLINAAEAYQADQRDATHPRCGLVQPITVQEAVELTNAIKQGREAMDEYLSS